MPLPIEQVEIETSRVASPSPELNASGKTRAVRAMFADIAPSYDRLNHLLSINIDRLWRRFTVKKLKDALRLPFADCSFDVVTIAFGLRNLENVEGGLAEILRVLKPGGCAAALEFSRPV